MRVTPFPGEKIELYRFQRYYRNYRGAFSPPLNVILFPLLLPSG